MLEIKYCGICTAALCQKGELLFSVFEHICEHFIFTGKPYVIYSESDMDSPGYPEIIKYLELNNYVVTTEGRNKTLLVKPIGCKCVQHKNNDVYCTVCMKEGSHD